MATRLKAREPTNRLFTMQVMVERSRVPKRTLQLWTDAGVLLAEGAQHQGTGNHRLYNELQLQIAALMRPLGRANVPIRQLVELADVLRQTAGFGPGTVRGREYQEGQAELNRLLTNAALGVGENWLSFVFTDDSVGILLINDEVEAVDTDEAGEHRGLACMLAKRFPDKAKESLIILVDATRQLSGLLDGA